MVDVAHSTPIPDLGRAREARNVLFVMVDQERAWDLYPEGFHDRWAPARAWVRDRGVSFTRFCTPTPICSTARGVAYSGAHSMVNGVWDNVPLAYASPLRRDVPTLGSLFAGAGYVTGYAGKWHLSDLPENPTSAAQRRSVRAEIASYGFLDTDVTEETDGALGGWRHDARTVDRALRFIRRHHRGDRPWMLAVNLLNPHDVMYYTAGPEMTAGRATQFPDASARPPIEDPLYAEDLGYDLTFHYGPATSGGRARAVDEYRLAFEEAMGHLPYDDLDASREMQNYYWNCTRDSDRHLARLLDGARDLGALDDAIVVLTSDHGEMLGTHGIRGKGASAFRETSRIPAIVIAPDAPAGAHDATVLSHLDWAPTLLGLIGVDPDRLREHAPTLTGTDFSPLVRDPGSVLDRTDSAVLLHWTAMVFMDHRNVRRFRDAFTLPEHERSAAVMGIFADSLPNRSQMRGIYDGRWKLQRYFSPLETPHPATVEELFATCDVELYDTEADPAELDNLARHPERWASEIADLNRRLDDLIAAQVGVDDGAFNPFARR